MSSPDPFPFADFDNVIPAGFNAIVEIPTNGRLGMLETKVGQTASNNQYWARILRTHCFVRPGLELRSTKEFLRMGQLTKEEFDRLRRLAKGFGKKIVLTGSYAETDVGLMRRYNLSNIEELGWRGNKPLSDLVGGGRGDLDIWEGSGLTQKELNRISKTMHGLDIDIVGYNLKRYPSLESLGDINAGPGALIFRSAGAVERILGAWQR